MEETEDRKQLGKKTVEPIPPKQTKHATNLTLFTFICIHHGRQAGLNRKWFAISWFNLLWFGHCPGSVWEPNCIVLGVDNQVQKVAPGGQICTKRVLSCSLWPWDPRNSRGATWQHNSVRSHKWVNSLQLKKVNHRPQNCKAWAILSEQRSDNFWWCQFIWVVPVFGKLLEFSAGRLRVLGSENKSTLRCKGWSEELSASPQWKHRWELMAFHICSYIPRAYTGHLVGTMLAKHFI